MKKLINIFLKRINWLSEKIYDYLLYIEETAFKCSVCKKISGHGVGDRNGSWIYIDCSRKQY